MEKEREQNPILQVNTSNSETQVTSNSGSCFDTTRKDLRAIWNMMSSKRMLWILPEIAWTGVSLSVYTGLLVPMISSTIPNEDDNSKLMKSMISMTTLGIGEILGALIIG